MKYFKTIFNSIDWDLLTQTFSTNDSYDIFLERYIKIYDQAFPEKKNRNKTEEPIKSLNFKRFRRIVEKETASK